jgi:gliding motility-associated-like protein
VNGVDFEWDFGDGNTDNFSNPSNTYNEPGTYLVTLIAIDEKGCTDTIIKPINIEDEWFLYVPNSFTPDDDRFNNTFEASTIGVQSLKIDIFNRWGEVVYQSNESNFIWNGTYNNSTAPDGTYTYSIEFITDSGRNKTQLGHVNLLR